MLNIEHIAFGNYTVVAFIYTNAVTIIGDDGETSQRFFKVSGINDTHQLAVSILETIDQGVKTGKNIESAINLVASIIEQGSRITRY